MLPGFVSVATAEDGGGGSALWLAVFGVANIDGLSWNHEQPNLSSFLHACQMLCEKLAGMFCFNKVKVSHRDFFIMLSTKVFQQSWNNLENVTLRKSECWFLDLFGASAPNKSSGGPWERRFRGSFFLSCTLVRMALCERCFPKGIFPATKFSKLSSWKKHAMGSQDFQGWLF